MESVTKGSETKPKAKMISIPEDVLKSIMLYLDDAFKNMNLISISGYKQIECFKLSMDEIKQCYQVLEQTNKEK